MEKLFGKTLAELKDIVASLALPAFTAKQIADWLYKKEITSIKDMSNLSLKAREMLSKNFEFGLTPYKKVETSVDDTQKYLYPTIDNKYIETAIIPDSDRKTICVSSQVGCKMGCLFCMTGKQGFQGQLKAGDILNQLKSLPNSNEITNIVYMGMGEPLDNLDEVLKSLDILTSDWGFGMSPRRITVSTIGLVPGLKTFLDKSECHLAVSLHTPFDDERRELMPIQNVYPIASVIDEIKSFDFGKQRRVSFEYIMFKGVNDTMNHVKELKRLLNGIKCRINLIRFHPIPGTPLLGSDDETIQNFKNALNNAGLLTTVRASRGEDIFAACGLLSTKELMLKKNAE